MGQAQLHLHGSDGCPQVAAQLHHVLRGHVGQPHGADEPLLVQLVQGGGGLLRGRQGIRAVQEQPLHPVHPEPLQGTLERGADGVPVQPVVGGSPRGSGVPGEPDAALGLDLHGLAQHGVLADDPPEHGLGVPADVDVRVVEERVPGTVRGVHGLAGGVVLGGRDALLAPGSAQVHAPVDQGRAHARPPCCSAARRSRAASANAAADSSSCPADSWRAPSSVKQSERSRNESGSCS